MSATTTRMLKEARPLFWPWCAVILAVALPLARPFYWALGVWQIGWFLGVPLLAALVFGNEFQHRTISLLLSQPVGRTKIWGEKLTVAFVAILSAALVSALSLRLAAAQFDPVVFKLFGAWIVATAASAAFWTLLTRSALGGVVLNVVINSFGMVLWGNAAHSLRDTGYEWATNTPVGSVAVLLYAGAMLWLGWRKLARFQATGAIVGDDLLTAGPKVMPSALAEYFCARPTGLVLNLIRKELRLLRPVWLITLLAALSWACLTLLGLWHGRGYSPRFETIVVSMTVITTLMIAVLAGTFSLGEEKTSGTHAWHLTLPAPAALQWSVKLCTALVAGVVGAGLMPTLALDRFVPQQLMVMNFRAVWIPDVNLVARWTVLAAAITLLAFWCACAADGTVAAVFWVFPAAIALGSAAHYACQFGGKLGTGVLSWHSNPFVNLRVAWAVYRLESDHHFRVLRWMTSPAFNATFIGLPALIFLLVQSYRLFHTQLQGGTRRVVRNLLLLVLCVCFCSLSVSIFTSSLLQVGSQAPTLVDTTVRAIQMNLPQAAKLNPTRPLILTVDDVVKAWPTRIPFPESAHRYLTNARITVIPDPDHPAGFYCTDRPRAFGISTQCFYQATIQLPDGTEITEIQAPETPMYFPDVRVRWPGTKREEPLRSR
jgi:hypothetical protein